ncbi:unnamed protein product [Schistosoma mattheei]|uniref:Uncharacterized protein n=1 Tax=Schistosoma mattheei TaxID=31246 RepID=A0A183NDE7_9TREM|nr:unnamed protein product [Schistosoma mattheei]
MTNICRRFDSQLYVDLEHLPPPYSKHISTSSHRNPHFIIKKNKQQQQQQEKMMFEYTSDYLAEKLRENWLTRNGSNQFILDLQEQDDSLTNLNWLQVSLLLLLLLLLLLYIIDYL